MFKSIGVVGSFGGFAIAVWQVSLCILGIFATGFCAACLIMNLWLV